MEVVILLLGFIILLLIAFNVGIWFIGKGVAIVKDQLIFIKEKIIGLEEVIVEGTESLEREVRNTTNGVEDTNEFLRTKGFTITFVSGLKDRMEEVLQASHDEKVQKYGSGPTATPGSQRTRGE